MEGSERDTVPAPQPPLSLHLRAAPVSPRSNPTADPSKKTHHVPTDRVTQSSEDLPLGKRSEPSYGLCDEAPAHREAVESKG